jgi:hypothetical protein
VKHITLCYTYFTVSCKLWLKQVPERLRVPLELPCWASILLTWIAGLCSVPVRLLYWLLSNLAFHTLHFPTLDAQRQDKDTRENFPAKS